MNIVDKKTIETICKLIKMYSEIGEIVFELKTLKSIHSNKHIDNAITKLFETMKIINEAAIQLKYYIVESGRNEETTK